MPWRTTTRSSGPGPLCSTTESASYSPSGGTVTAGLWYAAPSECGPYPASAPAGSATIDVTITPSAAAGAVVSGDLYVDDYASGVPPGDQLSGNELAAIPYEYTVGLGYTVGS